MGCLIQRLDAVMKNKFILKVYNSYEQQIYQEFTNDKKFVSRKQAIWYLHNKVPNHFDYVVKQIN